MTTPYGIGVVWTDSEPRFTAQVGTTRLEFRTLTRAVIAANSLALARRPLPLGEQMRRRRQQFQRKHNQSSLAEHASGDAGSAAA